MSPPCRVWFDGFESDTYTLQRQGWQLTMQQDWREGRLRLAMKHPSSGVTMLSEDTRHHFGPSLDRFIDQNLPEFRVCRVNTGRDVVRYFGANPFAGYMPVDAMPQMVERTGKMEDLLLFAAPKVRTEEIYVEPSSVDECLDLIKRLQSPRLAELRERDRLAEYRQEQKFLAQIVAVAA